MERFKFIEAARLDGAGEWYIFTRVIVPISRPVLGARAVLTFLGSWRSYIWHEIMASASSVAPLSIVLPGLVNQRRGLSPLYAEIMAGCTLAVAPVMLLFFRYQNVFVSGVTYGDR